MSYRLFETELYAPDYKHTEDFATYDDAYARMMGLYHDTAIEGNQDLIECAEYHANSAFVRYHNGNEIEWEIEEI